MPKVVVLVEVDTGIARTRGAERQYFVVSIRSVDILDGHTLQADRNCEGGKQ